MTDAGGAGLSGLPCPLRWVSLPVPVPQAQWDYVSLKYTQKKHSSKNSGVVILADLKVGLGPACSPSPPQWVEGVLPPQLCRE